MYSGILLFWVMHGYFRFFACLYYFMVFLLYTLKFTILAIFKSTVQCISYIHNVVQLSPVLPEFFITLSRKLCAH